MSNLINELSNPQARQTLGRIAEMLDRQGIDLADIGKINRVSVYQTITKNEEGEAEVHDLSAIQFSPSWESGPQWPVIQPGPAVKLPTPKVKGEKSSTGYKTAVILPDIQLGFYRDASGELVSTHDDHALEVALSIVKDLRPDRVILLGDNLDLPELSKYRLSPAFQLTTQETINRATLLCAQLRSVAPTAQIQWLAGNHEERMVNYVLDNSKATFGLRRGGTPDNWPVLSVPFLCRFDEFEIEYIPGYPAGHLWVNENLKIIHGTKHKSNGSTAHMYLGTEKCSVIYGHIHRREWAERTRDDWDGAKTIMAASPGCLAKIDGSVPSTKGGIDLDGRPMTVVEDWQQGIGVVTFQDHGDHQFFYEQVPIHQGIGFYRGKVYGA